METILWLDGVLILILMEHAQREDYKALLDAKAAVLILILMEHAQRDNKNMELSNNQVIQCLNPYFNGTCSKSGGYCVVNNNPYQS